VLKISVNTGHRFRVGGRDCSESGPAALRRVLSLEQPIYIHLSEWPVKRPLLWWEGGLRGGRGLELVDVVMG